MKIERLTLALFAPTAVWSFNVPSKRANIDPLREFTYGNVQDGPGGDPPIEGSPTTKFGEKLADAPMSAADRLSKISGGGAVKKTSGPGTGATVADMQKHPKTIWERTNPILIQGGSLRTWSFATPAIERIQIAMKTEGRPLNANLELWHGPDNCPQRMGIYIEDGSIRPFSAIIETPRGHNAIAIRNTGHLEFPLSACVEPDIPTSAGAPTSMSAVTTTLIQSGSAKLIQGGAVRTYPFDPAVASVQIMLKTDGRPLNAKIELLQGPNNNKQVMEIYTEDGHERPFYAVIDTPGTGNVVRIINTATVEFPLSCSVEPYVVETTSYESGVIGWDGSFGANNVFLDRQW